MTNSKIEPNHLQSVDRVVSVLHELRQQGPLGVGELARRLRLSKGSVHRLLAALQVHRLVEQDANSKRYRLGFRLVELGNAVINQLDYPHLAGPYLRALVDATRETAHLAMMVDGGVYYIAKVEGMRALRMPSHVGAVNPLHCTAVGKAILAAQPDEALASILSELNLELRTVNTITDKHRLREELEFTRARGYAVDDEELELGLRCLAAAVTDHMGATVAAVSVSGPVGRIDAEGPEHDRIASLVKAAATSISREFGSDVTH